MGYLLAGTAVVWIGTASLMILYFRKLQNTEKSIFALQKYLKEKEVENE